MKLLFVAFATLQCLLIPLTVRAAPPVPSAIVVPKRQARYVTFRKKRAKRYDISITYPVFSARSPVSRLANRSLREYAEHEAAKFIRLSLEDSDAGGQGTRGPGGAYELEIHPAITLARPDMISIYFSRYSFSGGVHPNTDFPAFTFGMIDGAAKLLALSDLFTRGTDPYAVLTPVTLPKLKALNASSVVGEDSIKKLDRDHLRNWCVTPAGITLLFAPYDVASYAEGAFPTKIPFAELRGSLDAAGPLRAILPADKARKP